MQKPVTFLMFDGKAEKAINFYLSVFKESSILQIAHYGKNEGGAEGSIQLATIVLAGQVFMLIDSPVKHNFSFTPAISIYVNCETDEEINTLFTKLSQHGTVFMPLGPYPFSKKFGWLADQFGVSWQVNLIAT
ncbi:VOC family protein [Ferruginibacter sp. SUN106]|uniref:VOC family protein n=1 Tax=Ferruginibacter sp. SUN106 TaxID=2978348 RepID=UPI003D36F5EB